MATLKYIVDTQPMADELNHVSRHVGVTTGAVVAMQAAVIAAEEDASNHVCNNVNRGFYSLIRSQISQKLAKLQSEVDSHVMQLVQQKKALLGIKYRMERDYNMIANRYVKLFNGLNANLQLRVFELDKPTIDFARKEVDKIANRTKYLASTLPVVQLESITLSQKIIASNIKQRGFNVINSMKGFIHEMNLQKNLTNTLLVVDFNNRSDKSYIPIVIYECNWDKSEHKNVDVVVSDVELSSPAKSAIKNVAFKEFSDLVWTQCKPSPEVQNEYNKLVSSSAKSSRVNDLTLHLFQSNNYLTIQMK